MRGIYIFLLVLLGVFLIIQFIRPEKNLGSLDPEVDFLKVSQVPDTLGALFLNSCYDCHSDQSRYPWYNRIAPVSWYLNKHITEGKSHLNFSSWGILGRVQKISVLDQICEECTIGTMPLKSYLFIHGDSRLGEEDIKAICEWAETEAMKILTAE